MLAWGVCALVVGTIIWEYYRGARARHTATGESWPVALLRVMARNQRRYGGYIVHLGVIMIAVAIVGATAFQFNLKTSLHSERIGHPGRLHLHLHRARIGASLESRYDDRQCAGGEEMAR